MDSVDYGNKRVFGPAINEAAKHCENANWMGIMFSPNTFNILNNPDTASWFNIVMIHEWWGLNDHIKDMADELAEEGYVVLAADMFLMVKWLLLQIKRGS